jgi:hypothetical protein
MLTERAITFLRAAEFKIAIRDRSSLIAMLETESLPYSEVLLAFQQQYGGLIF